nr:MAG TPA: hypothetical protein [Caudoviricetes sp.]
MLYFSLTQFRDIVINAISLNSDKFLNVLAFTIISVYLFFSRRYFGRNSGIVFAGLR